MSAWLRRRSAGRVGLTMLLTLMSSFATARVASAEPADGVMTVDATSVVAGDVVTVTQVTECPVTNGAAAWWLLELVNPADVVEDGDGIVVGADGAAAGPVALTVPALAPTGQLTITARCAFDVGGVSETTMLTYVPVDISVQARPVGSFEIDRTGGPVGSVIRITSDDVCPAPVFEGADVMFNIGFRDDGASAAPFTVGHQSVVVAPGGFIMPFDLTVPHDALPGAYTLVAYCSESVPGLVVKTKAFEDRPFDVLASEDPPDPPVIEISASAEPPLAARQPVEVLGSVTLPRTGRSPAPLASTAIALVLVGSALCAGGTRIAGSPNDGRTRMEARCDSCSGQFSRWADQPDSPLNPR